MRERKIITNLVIVLFSFLWFSMAYADDAEVLPKGVSRVSIDNNFYLPVDQRYNPDGEAEDVDVDYNTTLDSGVFTALSLVEAAFGMPSGSANIGDSVVSFEYDFNILNLSFQHGITERMSAGILIPYWWVQNNISAEVVSTTATVGKSAIGTGFGAPLVPLAGGGPFGDAAFLTTDDVQNLLGGGLDINGDGTMDISGFGYDRIETWSGNGIGDVEAGVRYQYLKSEEWRLAFTGGARFPTGEIDDPDNLVDYGIGSGAYALLLRFNNDYTGIRNLILNGTLRYDLVLPDKETKRVPEDVNLPITTVNNKERVERDLGDIIELEASGKYALRKGFNVNLLYKYGFKLKDQISGDLGLSYQSLEEETDYTEHVVVGGFSYSTVPLYMEKKFPLPLTASISYRNRFAGSNNIMKSEYIALGLQVFF